MCGIHDEASSSLTWSLDQELGVLRLTFHGAWPPPERFQELARLLRDVDCVRADLRLLIDVRKATAAGAPFYDQMRRFITPQPDSPRRRAFVVATDWQAGICNQLCALSERHGLEARQFTSESEALSWLVGQAPNDEPS